MKFLTIIVVSTLLFMPVCAAIFVILQLTTDLDPTPYLTYLAVPATVELIITAAIEVAKKYINKKKDEGECVNNNDINLIGFYDNDESEESE